MPETRSPKQATQQLLKRLGEDATYEDIMYELYVLQKIERGLRDAEEGRTVSHEADSRVRSDFQSSRT